MRSLFIELFAQRKHFNAVLSWISKLLEDIVRVFTLNSFPLCKCVEGMICIEDWIRSTDTSCHNDTIIKHMFVILKARVGARKIDWVRTKDGCHISHRFPSFVLFLLRFERHWTGRSVLTYSMMLQSGSKRKQLCINLQTKCASECNGNVLISRRNARLTALSSAHAVLAARAQNAVFIMIILYCPKLSVETCHAYCHKTGPKERQCKINRRI